MQTDNPFEMVLDRLRKKGWCKNQWGTANGPNCINGAAEFSGIPDRADFQVVTSQIALEQFRDRVMEEAGNKNIIVISWMSGVHFNNRPDTTFEDVERVLEKAAIKWEEDQING